MKQYLFTILSFLVLSASAQVDKVIPAAPNPPRLVNDFTGTLTDLQKENLEHKLVGYDDTTSNQIVVVIVNSLNDYDAYEYATALGRKWGVGNKAFNNGVVFLIAKDDRQVFIAPGYGLEGALPDVTCKQIIDNEILPNFRGNDYYRGIDAGVTALMQAAAGEYQPPEGYANRGRKEGPPLWAVLLGIFIVVVIISKIGGGKGGGGGSFMSRRGYRDSGIPPVFWFPGGGSSRGGGWGGGGSSGGFGGFGGGGFGGGGAGGRW